jgi:hypothetical protein
MRETKENDAKVMYCCLKLPDDPDAGEASSVLIERYTGLSKWQVHRSLNRLLSEDCVSWKEGKPGATGHYLFWVDDEKHITKHATAWLAEKLIGRQHSGRSIFLEEFLGTLKPPKGLSHLKHQDALDEKIEFLLGRGYIKQNDEPDTISVSEKTTSQRRYIELLAQDLPLPRLAAYKNHSKPPSKRGRKTTKKKARSRRNRPRL